MVLKADKLTLKYEDNWIFKNLSLTVESGEILGICGENGSGKSSLALCLAGLIDNDINGLFFKGNIFFDDKNLSDMSILQKCKSIGIIFQNPDNQIFSPLVCEELAFAPENLAVENSEMRERVEKALDICHITHLKDKKNSNLSGGEKQLVAIASVLTMQPKILIADEITARVDIQKKKIIRELLVDYAKNGGIVLIISHNTKDMEIATKTITLTKGKDYAN